MRNSYDFDDVLFDKKFNIIIQIQIYIIEFCYSTQGQLLRAKFNNVYMYYNIEIFIK